MANSWLLETRELTKDFGGLRAVNRLSFGIGHKEIVGLIGPNGSGKSTCINAICGVYRPSSGQVLFNDQRITGSPPWKVNKLGIARTFQHTHLFPNFPVIENLVIGRHVREKTGIADSLFLRRRVDKERKEAEAVAMRVLESIGLSEYAYQLATNLPPGAQRLLAIAMALTTQPQVLMLDEPAAGLSAEESLRLVGYIRELRNRGLSVLVVDHHMKVIMTVCDRLVVIDHGTQIAEGLPKDIANNEQVIEAYLGHARTH